MAAGDSTRTRLLAAAIEQIEAGGERSVRLSDVSRTVGVSIASIYHFFGSRDGLVEAAQLARYTSSLTDLNGDFVERTKAISSRTEFVSLMRSTLEEAIDDARAPMRATRIEVIGFARARPVLTEQLVRIHGKVVDRFTKAVLVAQVRGWCRRDLHPEAVCAWILTVIDGRYLVEMDPNRGDLGQWNAIVTDAVLAVSGNVPMPLMEWQPAAGSTRRRPPPTGGTMPGWRSPSSVDAAMSGAFTTRQRLLDAAAEQIAAGGEQALRVRDVAAAAGVTQPSVYHFFGSREGLLVEVQARRYSSTQQSNLELFGEAVAECRSRREFAMTIRRHLELAQQPDRFPARSERMEVLGSALSLPPLAERVVVEQNALNGQLAAALEFAQERGWVRPDLDTYLFSAWVLGQILAREMVPGRLVHLLPQWSEIVIDAVLSASGNPPPSLFREGG